MSKESSNFHFYSQGIVVTDKVAESDVIRVYPSEVLRNETGDITEERKTLQTKVPTQNGLPSNAVVNKGKVIEAKWIPLSDSNRMTAPDVVKGESVILYRFADMQDIYWTTIYREPHLRRLEKVCYMYGNLSKPGKPFDKSSSWWVEFDTKQKKLQVHLSNSDGEPVVYDLLFDTKNGLFVVKDDKGQSVGFNSTKGELIGTAKATAIITAPKLVVNGKSELKGAVTISGSVKVSGIVTAKNFIKG